MTRRRLLWGLLASSVLACAAGRLLTTDNRKVTPAFGKRAISLTVLVHYADPLHHVVGGHADIYMGPHPANPYQLPAIVKNARILDVNRLPPQDEMATEVTMVFEVSPSEADKLAPLQGGVFVIIIDGFAL